MTDAAAACAPGGSCCGASPAPGPRLTMGAEEAEAAAREIGPGLMRLDLSAPDMHCGACVSAIESRLGAMAGVTKARVNLTERRVGLEYRKGAAAAADLVAAVEGLGYAARPLAGEALRLRGEDRAGRELLARIGVSGFAAMNLMTFSVAVWSGAEGETRDLMHWISAAIALPTLAYAGQPFFLSAWRALRVGRVNMDVPIALALLLAAGMSLYETIHHGPYAYFDGVATLIFLLLCGRYLEARARRLARSGAADLARFMSPSAQVAGPDGALARLPIDAVLPGMMVHVAPGERVPADGVVESGASDIDRALVDGESAPMSAGPGTALHAGSLNLTGPIRLRVTASGDATLLAEMARLVEAAEKGEGRTLRLADKAARLYVPIVHLVALVGFLAWWGATGDAMKALMVATTLLVITCPCALALAIPAVQASASGALLGRGVMLKDGAALEKLAEVDLVVFDKTGVLTEGAPRLTGAPPADDPLWPIAASLARASRHPLARALAATRPEAAESLENISETPGCGVEGLYQGRRARLGRPDWCGAPESESRMSLAFALEGESPRLFAFEDSPRPDAAAAVAALKAAGLKTAILSGDAPGPVAAVAAATGIDSWRARVSPAEKHAFLTQAAREGRRALMIGDGLNDAPALAAAHVSMAPASGTDVARAAASLVYLGGRLEAVPFAWRTARAARRAMIQNIVLSAAYNVAAAPVALSGHATPLIAAIAMSSSSLLVTLNALRLRNVS